MPNSQQMQVMGIDSGALAAQIIDTPTPAANDVLIRVAYAGVNHADIFQVAGSYPPPGGLPNIAGLEVSGEIVAMGKNVSQWQIGDKVCALLGGCGYAEYVCADASLCLPIPSNLSLKQAAALPECAATVWLALFMKADIQPNESILIHGGSSGIGTTAIQMLNAYGAEIIVTARTDEKCNACETLGATAINYNTSDFVEIIKAQGGVDVVLDMVGGDYVARNMKCLKTGGRLVNIALLNGADASIKASSLLLKQLTWMGITLRSQPLERKTEIIAALRKTVWPWVESGQFIPVIDSTFTLADAPQAHERMHKSLHIGKILLEVSPR